MDWKYLVCLALLNYATSTLASRFYFRRHRRQDDDDNLPHDVEVADNNSEGPEVPDVAADPADRDPADPILGMGGSNEKPSAELLPGQTLIRPNDNMLQSSDSYPKKHVSNSLVYGGPSSINRRPTDLLYTGFRRSSRNVFDALRAFQEAIADIKRNQRRKRRSLQYVGDLRRKSTSSESSSSSSMEQELNPGNPYTIHKDRYKQNWPWNFEMDGDHMNLNPHGPEFSQSWGPSGKDLFLARKWWYFNQDDYLPFR